ncbi:MAG: helix-turn-helix domain-containing protein [Desulfocapsaceae bacterium]|nr:helix-turn-helix domain-containing protein [Desulfocapsaceae bacterium]
MIAEKMNLVGSSGIVETAEMLFQSQGFDNTTVDDIINHLNISERIFYRHFESVDEILELLWSGSGQH